MKSRQLIIALCISVIASSTALPTRNELVVFRDDSSEASNLISGIFDVPTDIKITEMRVRSEIALRYACTSVVTHVRNPKKQPQEVTFRMLLPDTAFISNFTMILGGKCYKAYVREKLEAQQIYNQSVAEGLSAAHVATEARDSNHFVVSVNVQGNSTAVFDLRYEEFLVRRNGLYNHAINLNPGGPVQKMEVVVRIKESQKITKLFVPEIRSGNEVDATEKDTQNSKAEIRRGNSKREVIVTFAPDLIEQERLAEVYERKSKDKNSMEKFIGYSSDEDESEREGSTLGQFVVQYDVERSNNGEVLVNDGYFVHFLAPTSLPPLNKYVVFVLDTSGSMMGRKIDQLRSAMAAILSDLNPNDYFNIVEFNSVVTVHELKEADDAQSAWYSNSALVPPARATPENIDKAKVIVSELDVSGVTDIHSALEMAFNLVRQEIAQEDGKELPNGDTGPSDTDTNGSPSETDTNVDEVANIEKDLERMVIFLTDGDANEGETSAARIVTSITRKNSGHKRASLYTLAFGEEANRVFLRELSLRNEGFMRQIYVAADAALQLYDFYRQVSSPLLSHVQFQYPRRQIKEGSVSRTQFRSINAGSEVAVVGQIAEDVNEITPTVRGVRSSGDGSGRKTYKSNPIVAVNNTTDEHLPLERLWAYLTIRQLLDQHEADHNYSNDENSPGQKALNIALQYAFVTPLTSLVVVRPDEKGANEMRSRYEYAPRSPPIMAPVVPEATLHTSNEYASDGFSAFPMSAALVPGNTMKTYSVDRHFVGPTLRAGGVGRIPKSYAHTLNTASRASTARFTAISDHSNPTGSVVVITSSRVNNRFFNGPQDSIIFSPGRMITAPGPERIATAVKTVPDVTLTTGGRFNSMTERNYVTTPPYMESNSGAGSISLNIPEIDEQHKIIGGNSYGNHQNGPFAKGENGNYQARHFGGRDYRIGGYEINESPVALEKNEVSSEQRMSDWNKLYNSMGPVVMLKTNSTRVFLKLIEDGPPPETAGGDEECSNAIAVDEHVDEDSVCVYITRCYDMTDIIANEDYIKSYCVINDGYAGVCCPRSLVYD
ncbi:inter-alpha-trypsin inhibitor heavy chain H4 isoform X2 [Bicyclus anynana]|uniref:Inter-alpha-trypsin inhibitor heavy chain H4 isoform X2 n=1 Tax=Bicyclus anynana TaxID=110368 RepID=A0ABM3LDU0_BICAN|nr:inter-alpha-trypsin inhibitor heavy chain H4 isoform X2 [Bicyclus anynana]